MTRGIGSALLCEHANEVPARCPCPPECYCRREGSCRHVALTLITCAFCKNVYDADQYDQCPGCFTMTANIPDLKVDGTSGDEAAEAAMLRAFSAAFEIWKVRHRKYGRTNIARTADVGCYTRMEDKMSRLERWYKRETDTKDFGDESLSDTWIDIINYAAMGLLCMSKDWPV